MALHGAIAAAATPMKDGGSRLDEEAFAPLVAFLAEGGVDGLLACGTTGEGINLSVAERRRAIELFVAARPAGFKIAVHAGAQTTHDTVALAGHAMETGADAVAVIAPPYFPLDEHELLAHFRAAASACAPVPFYVYEFIGRSGYAVPIPVIERLRTEAPNLRGLKVSDTPWSAVEPYLLDGLDVFIGLEPLVLEGMNAGAAGAVSGLATAFPETVASLVHDRGSAAHDRVVSLRGALQGIPFISSMKHLLAKQGVVADPSVRAPLRGLTDAEGAVVGALLSPP